MGSLLLPTDVAPVTQMVAVVMVVVAVAVVVVVVVVVFELGKVASPVIPLSFLAPHRSVHHHLHLVHLAHRLHPGCLW